jgi:hypothetical protein
MGMFTKRSNSRWTESQLWEVPHVYNLNGFSAAAGGGQANAFRKLVISQLQAGKFALQVMVTDDYIRMASDSAATHAPPPISLWSADPWNLISSVMPAKVRLQLNTLYPQTHHLSDWSFIL